MNQEEIAGQLKTASEQLRTSQEVIVEQAHQIQDLQHALQSRDLAIKLASAGHLHVADLPEKVAELESKDEAELELEEKVASMHEGAAGPGHVLANQTSHGSGAAATDAMSFINP